MTFENPQLAAGGVETVILNRVLSLDGGGSKGVYTLGVLKEVEAIVNKPLWQVFDIIYGTSTGSIIAGLLGLGYSTDDIFTLYMKHVPRIMGRRTASGKSAALRELADAVFGDERWSDFKTRIGIVTTSWTSEKPMIFKSAADLAHGRKATFVPGFGCTVSQAVQASCSAYPFFRILSLETATAGTVRLADGGYCANNPTLYALTDATGALGVRSEDVRVLSVGCGGYPEPRYGLLRRLIGHLTTVRLLQKTLSANASAMEQLIQLVFPSVELVRVNDAITRAEFATDFLESNVGKLKQMYQLGRESFATREHAIRHILR